MVNSAFCLKQCISNIPARVLLNLNFMYYRLSPEFTTLRYFPLNEKK